MGPSRNIDRNWPFRLSPDDRGSYRGQRRGSPRSAPWDCCIPTSSSVSTLDSAVPDRYSV